MKHLILILFFVPVFLQAQIIHTVAPKESLYSLGRQYNIHPKELAAYNNISIETGLTIGQQIKIPAKGTLPPVAAKAPVKTEPAVIKKISNETVKLPVYHMVEKKETLYHISKLYNTVSIEDIRKWNNLSGDALSEGMNLIVGYRNATKNTDQENSTSVNNSQVTIVKPVVKDNQAIITKPIVTDKEEHENTVSKVNPVKEEVIKIAPVKEEVNKISSKNSNGGFFKSQYTSQTEGKTVKEETCTTGVFKSTSGWEDGKYYCLHNAAPASSIIKITNKATQKSVYAKVLDVIPDTQQNTGIQLRLSNAAAEELGAGENNFEALINY